MSDHARTIDIRSPEVEWTQDDFDTPPRPRVVRAGEVWMDGKLLALYGSLEVITSEYGERSLVLGITELPV